MIAKRLKKPSPCRLSAIATLPTLSLIAYPIAAVILMGIAERLVGGWLCAAVGIAALAGFVVFLRYLWRLMDWWSDRRRDEARENYRGIYRVLAPAVDIRTVGKEMRIPRNRFKPLFGG